MKILSTRIRKQISRAKGQVLKEYDDTLGLVLIGSVDNFFFYAPCREYKQKYFKHIEWDELKILRCKD